MRPGRTLGTHDRLMVDDSVSECGGTRSMRRTTLPARTRSHIAPRVRVSYSITYRATPGESSISARVMGACSLCYGWTDPTARGSSTRRAWSSCDMTLPSRCPTSAASTPSCPALRSNTSTTHASARSTRRPSIGSCPGTCSATSNTSPRRLRAYTAPSTRRWATPGLRGSFQSPARRGDAAWLGCAFAAHPACPLKCRR